jgi:hypothetical protein
MEGIKAPILDEHLAKITNQLNALTITVNNMNAIQTNHAQQLSQLNNGMQGVNQRLAELASQQADATRRITLAVNKNAMTQLEGAFVAFPFANNVIHPGFPPTVRDLVHMTDPQMTALLNAHGVYEIPDDIEARRARVEKLITTAL